ncbi:MAG TPA: DUF1730 domain-containing protein [Clostridiales bacterium]|nr:DUF1730 domain-containing protein [Clostridiales bacterium]
MEVLFKKEGIEYYTTLPWNEKYVKNKDMWANQCKENTVFALTVFLMPYYVKEPLEERNLSRYAIAKDYHVYFDCLLKQYEEKSGEKVLGFCDHSPLYEVEAALDGGLGVLGKNGLLIHEKYGSYVFIGIFLHTKPMVCSIPVPHKECLGCGACEQECPAKCIGGSKKRCLSALTQKKNRTQEEDKEMLRGKLLWGCDLCQEVCPLNRLPCETPLSFFKEELLWNLDESILERLVKKNTLSQRAFGWRGEKLLRQNIAAIYKKG